MANEDFIIKDGVLKKYNGAGGDVKIPAGVMEIAPRAFEKNEEVTTLRFCDELKIIGYLAFYNCINLREVVFNEGLLEIGDSSFCGCTSLSSLKLPASLKEFVCLDDYSNHVASTFEGCTAISSIEVAENNLYYASYNSNVIVEKASGTLLFGCKSSTIPKEIKQIGDRAFFKNQNLSEIELPIGLTHVGKESFFGCVGLQDIFIPASVIEIDKTAFSFCSLNSITVDPANEKYMGNGNTLVSKTDGTLVLGSMQSVIPNGAKVIGEYAFSGVNIKKVTIPASVRFIEEFAFSKSALEEIFLPEGVLEIKAMAFADCPNLKKVVLPNSLLNNADLGMDYGIANNAFLRSPIEEIIFNGTPEERRLLLKGIEYSATKRFIKTLQNRSV